MLRSVLRTASRVPGIAKAFDTLLSQGAFVKVGDDLYRGSQIALIHERIASHFCENARMTAAEFRDMLGTSRKYAVPLLEWMDSHGVTIRDGDYRKLRKREPHPSGSHTLPHTSRHSAD